MPDSKAEFAQRSAQFDDVRLAIRLHGSELLQLPGVVAVRPGYRFRNGRVTDEPAVQVTVERKRDITELTSAALIPRRLGKAVVDVVVSTPQAQLRLRDDMERAGPGGPESPWRISTMLPGEVEETDEAAALAGPILPYVPPAEPLAEVDEEMTVTCHASSAVGWRLLSGFFQRIESSLVSTMYEFTAKHILDGLLNSLKSPRTFEFVFDGKTKNIGTDDLSLTTVTSNLGTALDDRLSFAWAANAQTKQVTAGFFPSAYHIKVSVRDGEETWLSSGNWKNSNQPAVDPLNPPANFNAVQFEREHNRDWHVLVRNKNLASQFLRFIRHDLEQALPLQANAGPPAPIAPMPDLFIAIPDEELMGPPVFHPELTVSRRIRVQPLLTPDEGSYFQFVSKLVAEAESKIYFENQGLSPNNNATEFMDEMFLVLRDKCVDENLDVKIIVRGDFDPQEIITKLKFWGFRLDRVRLLNGCHTKGIIIDDKMVLLGSQNWTSQGAMHNRDASLVFFDEEIAGYYNTLFEYDWNRATSAVDDTSGPLIAQLGEPVPAGRIRVPWTAVFDED
jgi:PLD-like domain